MKDYGVGLLPEGELSQALIAFSRGLSAEFETSYALNGNILPHMPIYHSSFDDMDQITSPLSEMNISIDSISIEPQYVMVHESGLVTLECLSLSELKTLHENIFRKLSPNESMPEIYVPKFPIGRITSENFDSPRVNSLMTELTSPCIGKSYKPKVLVAYEMGIDGECTNPRVIV